MSVRALQRLAGRYTREGTRMEYPLEIIEHALQVYTEAIAELSEAAAHADCTSGMVGATKLMLETLAARIHLMIQVGAMPRNVAALADQADATELVARMADVIARHGLPDLVISELLEVVDAHADRVPSPPVSTEYLP